MKLRKDLILIIKEERLKKGYSQEELGYRSGLHRTYIGAVERGEKNLTVDTLEKIATGLGIDYKELFKFE